MSEQIQQLRLFFQQAAPFKYLEADLRERIANRAQVVQFAAGQRLVERGQLYDAVWIVLSGSCTAGSSAPQLLGAGQYFGDMELLFEQSAPVSLHANEALCVAKLAREDFLSLPRLSVGFAQSLAVILRDRRGIFSAFDRFRTEVLRGAGMGFLNIAKLIDMYRDLQPVLHRYAKDKRKLDSAALEYAIRRLPENISSTFALLLRDELPSAFALPDELFTRVETQARRRGIWELIPGKNLVMLRSGDSDLMDLICCLCIYAVEARKIRRRIYGSGGMSKLKDFCADADQPDADQPDADCSDSLPALLEELKFSKAEVEGLGRLWKSPSKLARRLYEITLHREMFSIDIRRQKDNFNTRRSEAWSQQITTATCELLGLYSQAGENVAGSSRNHPLPNYPSPDLPTDLKVHIISSNTHSITNCLNPWYRENDKKIRAWARAEGRLETGFEWENEDDRLYSLIRDYFRAHPEQEEASKKAGRAAGILTLAATPATGIQVQLIDSSRLPPDMLDSGLPAPPRERVIIVNIDYAFGEQAEHIIRNLMLIFGKRVQSASFLGKAGALRGQRGDILIPSSFIEQHSDTFRPVQTLGSADRIRPATISPFIHASRVHFGPMLTVEGTILQNKQMLKFYSAIWDILGLEMEGFHYQKQVDEAVAVGMANPRLRQRYYYYVSDLPLEDGKSLSKPLHPEEGIPPLYAITRAILSEIFSSPGA